MRIVSAVLAALVAAAGYYIAIPVMDRKYQMGLNCKGWRISSLGVLAVGGITVLAAGGIGYLNLQGDSPALRILAMLLIWAMSVLAVLDYKKQIVPNRFLLLMLLLWTAVTGSYIIVDTGNGLVLFFRALAGAVTGGLVFLLCYLLSGRKIGAGDVKLVFVMGLYLTGQRIIGAIFYGALLCCVYSLIQMGRKKLGLKDGVPIVPFLYLGTLITLLIF